MQSNGTLRSPHSFSASARYSSSSGVCSISGMSSTLTSPWLFWRRDLVALLIRMGRKLNDDDWCFVIILLWLEGANGCKNDDAVSGRINAVNTSPHISWESGELLLLGCATTTIVIGQVVRRALWCAYSCSILHFC
mmetsp:Transcript_46735/g.69125  ORF Transcript_46735/g.69125 Transcript_46735/m.69125 type:complete len:136 (+) Transcript_46735:1136-1543(+)